MIRAGGRGQALANIDPALAKSGVDEQRSILGPSASRLPQLQAQLQKSLNVAAAELYSETNPDEIALVFDEETRLLSEFLVLNNLEVVPHVPEVPFIHWSIYRQGIQNLLQQQGHKFSRNQKQLGKFLS